MKNYKSANSKKNWQLSQKIMRRDNSKNPIDRRRFTYLQKYLNSISKDQGSEIIVPNGIQLRAIQTMLTPDIAEDIMKRISVKSRGGNIQINVNKYSEIVHELEQNGWRHNLRVVNVSNNKIF